MPKHRRSVGVKPIFIPGIPFWRGTDSIWHGKTSASDSLRDFNASILERIDGISGWIEFHGNEPVIAKIREVTINCRVVYLACAGFVASRNIGDVNQPDLIDVID